METNISQVEASDVQLVQSAEVIHNHVNDQITHSQLHEQIRSPNEKPQKTRVKRDHPSYSFMIRQALTELKERLGSSQHAITKRVADSYRGKLSKTFNKHLAQQLKRMVSSNRIIKNKGRFRLIIDINQKRRLQQNCKNFNSIATHTAKNERFVPPPTKKLERKYKNLKKRKRHKFFKKPRKRHQIRRWRKGYKKKKRRRRKKIRKKRRKTKAKQRRMYHKTPSQKKRKKITTMVHPKMVNANYKRLPKRRKVTKNRVHEKVISTFFYYFLSYQQRFISYSFYCVVSIFIQDTLKDASTTLIFVVHMFTKIREL